MEVIYVKCEVQGAFQYVIRTCFPISLRLMNLDPLQGCQMLGSWGAIK